MSGKTLKIPKDKIHFSFLKNDYDISWPNNGQYIEIEVMKARLSGDTYNTISEGTTTSAGLARYTVDMIAFFGVCCPKIKEDLKVGSFSELKMIDSKKLLKVYLKEVLPWIVEWENVLNSSEEETEEEEEQG